VKIYKYRGKSNVSGDRIYQARVIKRMSQEELAAQMQCQGVTLSREAISRIETGERFVTDYELVNFARVLNVSLEWLVGNS